MVTAWRGSGKAHTNITFWLVFRHNTIPSLWFPWLGNGCNPWSLLVPCCPVGEYSKVLARWAPAGPLKATSNPGLLTGWLVLTTLPLIVQWSFFQGALDASHEPDAWPSTAFPPRWPAPRCAIDKLFRTLLVYGQFSFFFVPNPPLSLVPFKLSWISTENHPQFGFVFIYEARFHFL